MPGDGRYARLRDLLELCLWLEGSLGGVTIDDVRERYGVARRTAGRMLESLREAIGEDAFESHTATDGRKHWHLRRSAVARLMPWDAAELAAVENATRVAERDGRPAEARALAKALCQIRSLLRPEVSRRLDPDLEALIEAQGLAMRAGPRPRIDRQVADELRRAVLACRRVRFHHRTREKGPLRQHTVGPLGFLYGNRHYLVAWSPRREKPLLFRLSRITRVHVLDGRFETPAGFDLRAFAERSFGVFQEEPVDVVWRFAPEVAQEARQFVFHPTQQVDLAPDGTLLVRFRAGGLREMAWHLFTWGPFVEVLEPAALRRELVAMAREAARHHRGRLPQAVQRGAR